MPNWVKMSKGLKALRFVREERRVSIDVFNKKFCERGDDNFHLYFMSSTIKDDDYDFEDWSFGDTLAVGKGAIDNGKNLLRLTEKGYQILRENPSKRSVAWTCFVNYVYPIIVAVAAVVLDKCLSW